MKYSDEQRVAKIRETTEKLLSYIRREQITPERIFSEEPIQWAVTTPPIQHRGTCGQPDPGA